MNISQSPQAQLIQLFERRDGMDRISFGRERRRVSLQIIKEAYQVQYQKVTACGRTQIHITSRNSDRFPDLELNSEVCNNLHVSQASDISECQNLQVLSPLIASMSTFSLIEAKTLLDKGWQTCYNNYWPEILASLGYHMSKFYHICG